MKCQSSKLKARCARFFRNGQICIVNLKSFKFLVVVLGFAFCVLNLSFPAYATSDPISYEITISATIGEPKLTLFGYTSPHSLVELKGIGVSQQVRANKQGYFFFDRVFLPLLKSITPGEMKRRFAYPQLCLTTIDTQKRISFPTCLPPLPVGPFEITVGPILLPPTLSLEKGNFLPGEQVAAEGSTIPRSEVTIFLASLLASNSPTTHLASAIGNDRLLWLKLNKPLITPAYAYSLPKYQIQADKNGHFEFNLPAGRPTTWRVFAAATHLGSPTPKSNTLTFRVLNWWEWFWEKTIETAILLLQLLQSYLLFFIILLELIIIGVLLFSFNTFRRSPSGVVPKNPKEA